MVSARDILKRSPRLLNPVVRAYERRLGQYGADPRSVFWKDGANQTRRYDILYSIFDEADQAGNLTIHDFGCGYGAFFDYLKDKPVMRGSRYIGTDMSKGMIRAARRRIDDPRASFIRHVWALEAADYTFASGTFNMHVGQSEAEWDEYVKASLLQLWSKTTKGLAFNLLRPDAEDRYEGLFYADGAKYFDFCAARLSPDVVIENNEPLPDWTIFVRRRRFSETAPR